MLLLGFSLSETLISAKRSHNWRVSLTLIYFPKIPTPDNATMEVRVSTDSICGDARNDNTVVRELALHMTYLGSIHGILDCPPALVGVIPEYRVRSKL